MKDIHKYLIAAGFSSVVALTASQLSAPSEGEVNTPYLDVTHVRTVCYGQTDDNSSGTKVQDRKYSDEECVNMLGTELEAKRKEIEPLFKVKLNDYQEAAMLDFAFNAGVPALKQSSMLREFNNGNPEAACNSLLRWVFAGSCQAGTPDCVKTPSGKYMLKLQGLVVRREKEMQFCLNGLPK